MTFQSITSNYPDILKYKGNNILLCLHMVFLLSPTDEPDRLFLLFSQEPPAVGQESLKNQGVTPGKKLRKGQFLS